MSPSSRRSLIWLVFVNLVILVNLVLVDLIIESVKRSFHLNVPPTVRGEIC
jgi:hypothetical protein